MRFFLALAALAAVAGCGSDGGTAPAGNTNATYTIYTIGDTFSPALGLQIAPNDTVEWHFAGGSDGNGHNVRFTPRPAGTPANIPVQKAGTVRSVFTTRGDFNFFCDVHPGMQGSLTVQ